MNDDADPATPTGARTLAELLDAAARDGYTEQFDAVLDRGEPRLRCSGCDTLMSPDDMTVAWVARTEGASDPADELYVAAVELHACDAKGVYIAGYGPQAGAADAAMLPRLPDPARPGAEPS